MTVFTEIYNEVDDLSKCHLLPGICIRPNQISIIEERHHSQIEYIIIEDLFDKYYWPFDITKNFPNLKRKSILIVQSIY